MRDDGWIAGWPEADRRSLAKLLKGDLDWIVLKALEKDRRLRYATAKLRATLGDLQ